jgi:hypothetical protein
VQPAGILTARNGWLVVCQSICLHGYNSRMTEKSGFEVSFGRQNPYSSVRGLYSFGTFCCLEQLLLNPNRQGLRVLLGLDCDSVMTRSCATRM